MPSKRRRCCLTKPERAEVEALIFEEYIAARHRLMHSGELPWPEFTPLPEGDSE